MENVRTVRLTSDNSCVRDVDKSKDTINKIRSTENQGEGGIDGIIENR